MIVLRFDPALIFVGLAVPVCCANKHVAASLASVKLVAAISAAGEGSALAERAEKLLAVRPRC